MHWLVEKIIISEICFRPQAGQAPTFSIPASHNSGPAWQAGMKKWANAIGIPLGKSWQNNASTRGANAPPLFCRANAHKTL